MQPLFYPIVTRRFTRLLTLLLTLLVVFGSTSVSYAEIPATISYQGVLTDAAGAVVPNGDYKLTFTIYGEGPIPIVWWTETHERVAVRGGIFQVVLGSVNSLAALPFDQPYQLGITVNHEPELTPRLPFTAVPYSLSARTLAPGAAVTSLNGFKDAVTLTAGQNVSITPNGNMLTIAANGGGTGDGHSLDAADGSPVDALVVDANGQVGIGLPAPTALLDVNGSTQLRNAVGIGGASPNSTFPLTVRAAANTILMGFQDQAGAGQWHLTYGGVFNGLNFAESGVADGRLFLQDGGNVGIGTAEPTTRLDVNGNIKVANNVTGDGNLRLSGDSAGGPDFMILNDGQTGLRFAYPNVALNVRGSSFENFLFNVEPPTGTPVFTVEANRQTSINGPLFVGNTVTLGTAQQNARLEVNGTTRLGGSIGIDGNVSMVGALALAGNSTGGPDFIINSGGQAGFHQAYSNVTLNVRGVGESNLFTVESSQGSRVVQVQEDKDVFVNGSFFVSNGVKLFIIDNPLNPANESLRHNAVEGPGYYTFYHGNVVLDDKGEGWVQLPDYFEALNTEVSYNLTPVGGYAPVYVAQEVQGNRFLVAGGKAGLKVSWQVTANRNDPYAVQHPFEAVVPKTADEQGHYYYPEGYGQPETMSMSRINPHQQLAAPDAESGQ